MKQNEYITKHKIYIDRRIKIISSRLLENAVFPEKDVTSLINALMSDDDTIANNQQLCDQSEIAIKEIHELVKKWDIISNGDILGYIYQGLRSRFHKKKFGQFFTPPDIVDHLLNESLGIKPFSLEQLKNFRLLDPACGSGQFLIKVFCQIYQKYRDLGLSPEESARQTALNNIHGFDIDKTAINIARWNLARLSGCSHTEINIKACDFLHENEQNLFFNNNELPQAYTCITGNPPWGSKLSPAEKKNYRGKYISAKSGINTFTLFIERSSSLLQNNGTLAFLIPDAYLNIKSHQCSRTFVLENFKIKEIGLWGERFKKVFAPAITIVLNEEKDHYLRRSNIINIRHFKETSANTAVMVPQASYLRTPENIFNIHASRKAESIIEKIPHQECMYLRGNSTFFLGVVTGNNKKYISAIQDEEHPDPILIGADVKSYSVNHSDHYFKYDPDKLQQVAPQLFYLTENKILYRFIGKRLNFAIDRRGYYSVNNINGFISGISCINQESLVAILNSCLIQHIYQNTFFTLKVLRRNLERLPLKLISAKNQAILKKLTGEIMDNPEGDNSCIRENIEDIIFHEYGISDRLAHTLYDRHLASSS